jgi:hypothetical protein
LNRTIEASAFKDRFPKAELVTYRYYVGRKYMFDNSFKEAEEYLRSEYFYSLQQCWGIRNRIRFPQDPLVFGPRGSGSNSRMYGSRSGSGNYFFSNVWIGLK